MSVYRCDALCSRLLGLLRQQPSGLSEFALLKALRAEGVEPFASADLAEPLALFRCNFLLMNALYRLRLHLRQEETGDLEIHPLSNRVRPYHRGEEGLTLCDPLADYYLDMGQLEGVDREDVEALLNGFDRFMAVRDQRAEALAVLGLVEPVDDAAIRRRYRELAMAYHPDRGGDGERLKAINQAMGLLRPR